MKRRTKILFAGGLLALMLVGAAIAGQVEDAIHALAGGDYATAMQLLRPPADQGDAISQAQLGWMYLYGKGVPQDYAQAAFWYRRAADQGAASGQAGLGLLYYTGHGVPQDYAQAAFWYRKSADQGDFVGQGSLGVMCANGQGVPQDHIQAHMWFNLAASRASDDATRDMASKSRDLEAARMTPSQIAEAQRLAREWKPTEPGR